METLNYKHITSNEDRKLKRNSLSQRMGSVSRDFNDFVKASILFFYQDGNKQINIINDVILIAHHSKGAVEEARLCDYLNQVIPHKLDESEDEANCYGAKLQSKQYLTLEGLVAFLGKHGNWAKFRKPKKVEDFDGEGAFSAYLKRGRRLADKLNKNNMTEEARLIKAKLDELEKAFDVVHSSPCEIIDIEAECVVIPDEALPASLANQVPMYG